MLLFSSSCEGVAPHGSATVAGRKKRVFQMATQVSRQTFWNRAILQKRGISVELGVDSGTLAMGGNWNPASDYEWLFVTTGSTISTFDAAQFSIDQANFDRYNAGTGACFPWSEATRWA